VRTRTLGCADFRSCLIVAVDAISWRVVLASNLHLAVLPVADLDVVSLDILGYPVGLTRRRRRVFARWPRYQLEPIVRVVRQEVARGRRGQARGRRGQARGRRGQTAVAADVKPHQR